MQDISTGTNVRQTLNYHLVELWLAYPRQQCALNVSRVALNVAHGGFFSQWDPKGKLGRRIHSAVSRISIRSSPTSVVIADDIESWIEKA